eukprot:scaffold7633_cov102-Isochrysis_galbana.AAC.2
MKGGGGGAGMHVRRRGMCVCVLRRFPSAPSLSHLPPSLPTSTAAPAVVRRVYARARVCVCGERRKRARERG